MSHIVDDNTAEWDARVQQDEERKERLVRRGRIGVSAGVLMGLLAGALSLALQPKQQPAVAAPPPAPAQAEDGAHPADPLEMSLATPPGAAVLNEQAQSLAVELARIWRGGKSEEAAEAAHSYTVEYERMVGCDLRWIAGRAGPGVWKGTTSLVRSLREITPHVGRAREGEAVVVTAVICPS